MKTVLIIDREESAARQVAEVCAGMGLRPETLAEPAAALERVARGAPDLVVLDLGGSGLEGLFLAERVRAQPGAGRVPVLLISAAHRDLPAGKAIPGAMFMSKPLQLPTLQSTISVLLGMAAPARAAGSGEDVRRGTFAERTGGALLVELWRARATGMLDATSGQVRRRVYLQGGQLRYGTGNVKSENVGGMQVAAGALKEKAFEKALAHAKQNRVPLHEALLAVGAMDAQTVQDALRLQTIAVAGAVAAARSGSYEFASGPVGAAPDATQPMVLAVLKGMHGSVDEASARQWLETQRERVIGRSGDLDRELFAVKNSFPGEAASSACNGRTTVGDALGRLKGADVTLLYALCASGLASLGGSTAPVAGPGLAALASGSVPAADADAGVAFTDREREAREQIFAEHRRLGAATHYQTLGVGPQPTPEEIKKGYLAAAKVFHSDAFAGLNLGSAARALEDIFARISEAQTVLTDADQRANYDIFLDRKAKGLPTDVAAILNAESVFTRGQTLYKRGKYDEAEAAFREATALNHSEAEFWAFLGAAIFRRQGAAGLAEARSLVEKSLQMMPDLPSALLFAGQIARAEGEPERAEKLLRKALEKDPKNVEVERELKALATSRNEPQKAKGLLSRLFGK